jgi:pimeloyl-ACP methyl ester carboxylesterase
MEALIRKGYTIVATDYQGLGGPGDHQYGLHRTAALDAINSIRAARNFKPAQAGNQAVLIGWSQGGGAVLMAAGLNDDLAGRDDVAPVQLVGVVGLAPSDARAVNPGAATTAAEADRKLAAFTRLLSGSQASLTHLSMFYWGLVAGNPGLNLRDVFSTKDLSTISTLMRNKCVHELGSSYSYTYGNNLVGIFKPNPSNALAWTRAINKGLVASIRPVAPVLMTWGNRDTVVPPVMHEVYAKQACANGAKITRVELSGDNTHFSTPTASEPLYLPWIADRFAGKPAGDNCAAIQAVE